MTSAVLVPWWQTYRRQLMTTPTVWVGSHQVGLTMDDDGYVLLEMLREIRDELREINAAVRAMNVEPVADVALAPVHVPRITTNKDVMGGVPCIRDLRIPATTVVGMRLNGMTDAEILEAYPDLCQEDIDEAMRWVRGETP